MWDDREVYDELSAKALREAERWHPDRVRPLYAEFFRNARCQPGAPVRGLAARPGHPGRGWARPGVNGSSRPVATAAAPPVSFSFVACVSDETILKANLLASPDLARPGSPHEVTLIREAPSAAAGYVMGRQTGKHEWNVFVHQDVWLPEDWDRRIARQLREAEARFGPIGVAGVYGVGDVIESDDLTQPLGAERIGWVVDRGRELRDGPELPATVATLDELAVDRAPRLGPAVRPGAGVSPLRSRYLPPGTRTGARGRRAWCGLPAQFSERRAATGILSERQGLRPQMEPPAAGRHAVRHHRPGRCGPGSG